MSELFRWIVQSPPLVGQIAEASSSDSFSPAWILFSNAALVAIVASIGYFWSRVRIAESEAMLKREMILRGLTAEEMERILNARSARSGD